MKGNCRELKIRESSAKKQKGAEGKDRENEGNRKTTPGERKRCERKIDLARGISIVLKIQFPDVWEKDQNIVKC